MKVDEIQPSPILGLVEEVFRRRQKGDKILALHIGEPDFPTPPGIREAAYRAMNEGWTHYAPAAGLPELRSAIADRLKGQNKIDVHAENIVVTSAKFGIYATLLACVGPGDEVLLPDPTYLFDQPIRLAGATPVYVPLRADFSLDANALFDAVTPQTRAIVLATPGNPTGRVFRRSEVRDIVEIAEKRGLLVISDETYDALVYDGTHVSAASLALPETPVVTIGSFSKRYAMTGWRAGYVAAPPAIRDRVVRVMEHTLTCLPPFIQRACLWALENAAKDEERFREAFRERRDHVVARLGDLPGLTLAPPEGAFYAFPRYEMRIPSVEFCSLLLREEAMAVVPGVAFGPHGESHFRLSFTSPLDDLEDGVVRLGRFIERHGGRRGA
jgi:aspartate aminotransferase